MTAGDEMVRWETGSGLRFLKRIGVKADQKVLDFGSGVGHYAIPAAIVVGDRGMVYAVDKDQEVLAELGRKAVSLGLRNIRTFKNSGGVDIVLRGRFVDVVLLYDVLHYFTKDERKKLYKEVRGVLKPGGLLSVYPKHLSGDEPLGEFRKLGLNDVKLEIQNSGFSFREKYCDTLSHNNNLNFGCVLNFINNST